MKVAIDARGINWYKGTGIGTYTENILKNLLEINGEDTYHIYWSGEDYEYFKRHNSKIVMASKKHHRFFEQSYFPNNIESEGATLYHIPQNGMGLSPNIKCKTIVTIHDLIPYTMPETVGKGYLLNFLKDMPYIIEKADGILTVSEYSKQDILRFFPIDEDKIYVTPLAADTKYKPLDKDYCKKKIEEVFNISKDFILYLGGFSSRKNVKGLIEAFHKVYKTLDKEYVLVILGSIRDEGKNLLNLVEDLGMKDKVIFTGFVEEDLLPVFYNASHCFVYPSLYEGFGLPPLEAMSCGCPVITSNISSIPEVVGESGYLIDPYDFNNIAKALGEVMTNESLREKLSKRSIERAKLFSWRNTAINTSEAYKSVIQKSTNPS